MGCDRCRDCQCVETEIITKTGKQGDGGPIGPAGPAGSQGIIGAQGGQGLQGAKGDQGDDGPDGPAGPGGVATSLDFSSAVIHSNAAPAVIMGIGWNTITPDAQTETDREEFGDLNQFSGKLKFLATNDGIGDSNVLVQFDGPLLSSAPEREMQMIAQIGDVFFPVIVFPDPIGPVNYLRVIFPNEIPVGVPITVTVNLSGMTFY